jgi:hypothetical protein
MKSLADFLTETKISSVPSDNSSVQSRRSEHSGTLKREGIHPILSDLSRVRPHSSSSSQQELRRASSFLEKRRWLNLGEGWHQITTQGSGAITRCGMYSIVENSGASKIYACLYIPRLEAAYNASLCDKPEFDLHVHLKIHSKPNSTISPQFELILAYKNPEDHLILKCDALSKCWSLIHHNGGRDCCITQIPDANIRNNVFYALLVQIRINCISIDVNGAPIITKLKIPNVAELSGFMGLKAKVNNYFFVNFVILICFSPFYIG